MEARNQTIAVAIGVGALGTALAFLTYSHINKVDKSNLTNNLIEEDNDDQSSWVSNLWTNNKKEKIEQDESIEQKDESIEKNSVKKEWGSFWKKEYNEQKKTEKE